MAVPEITDEQRRESLREAARIRALRAAMRAAVRDGQLRAADVVAAARKGDRAAAGMRVAKLIDAAPGYGPRRTRALMERIGIAANRRVGGLGATQAKEVVAALDYGRRGAGGKGGANG